MRRVVPDLKQIIVSLGILMVLPWQLQKHLFAVEEPSEAVVEIPTSAGGFSAEYFGFDGASPTSNTVEIEELFISKMIASLGAEFRTVESEAGAITAQLKLIGKPLNYPNPFTIDQGTEIGMMLESKSDFEIYIFNMLGHKVAQKVVKGETLVGELKPEGIYCKVKIEKSDIPGYVSPGGYFYLIVKDKTIMAKGKMAILP